MPHIATYRIVSGPPRNKISPLSLHELVKLQGRSATAPTFQTLTSDKTTSVRYPRVSSNLHVASYHSLRITHDTTRCYRLLV